MNYRKEIDGLRAVALLPVIFYHAGYQVFSGAFVMLDVFFVISGYLISSLILKDLEKGTFSLVQFYERRARRILPALFLVMLCCIPFAWTWLMPLEFTMFAKSLIAVCLFSSNFLFWKESGYFEPATELKPLLHTWSLAVEEQFYLIFPLLFLFAWKWKKRGLFFLILLTSGVSLAIMQWGSFNSPDANYYLLPGRAWEFLLGMLITLVIQPVQKKVVALPKIVSELAALLGMTLLVTSLFTFNKYEAFPSLFAFIPLIGTALIILFATPSTFVGKVLCNPPLVGIGLISYSGYLWHQPLFAFARQALLKEPDPWVFAILIVINFVLSYFSWRFVEQPFRTKNLFSKKQVFTFAGSFSAIIIALGTVGTLQKGFPNRFWKGILNVEAILKQIEEKRSPALDSLLFYPPSHQTVSLFLIRWTKSQTSQLALRKLPLAFFGDSLGRDVDRGMRRNGFLPLSIFGAGCSINPNKMSEHCQELAHLFLNDLKTRDNLQYLALYMRTHSESDLSIDFFKEAINFWKKSNLKLIIFSQKPEFYLLKEQLQRGQYPQPNFKFSELSLRRELKDFFASQNVHLIDSKYIFCKISGNCDFKIGSKTSFKPEDFIYSDGWHLSATGQKEFGRILLETDPVFREMIGRNCR